MAFTLDSSGLQQRLNRVRTAAPAAVAAALPDAAVTLVEEPPYAAPTPEETGPGPAPDELLTDLERGGTAAAIGIATLYDWVRDPNKQHCSSPDGLDCTSFAAGGPYTADFPYRPRDGTTPCGDRCGCSFVARAPTWTETGAQVVAGMGAAIGQDLNEAWRM